MSTLARAPFDNNAADIVIRSRDGVDFRVRSGILAEASPIFSDMFTLPRPPPNVPNSADYVDGKPVVDVEEDSETLDRLLRLCYPTADPKLPEPRDVRLVLAAALKYEMEEAVTLMKKALIAFLDERPLVVWASACILGLETEARVAADKLLTDDLPSDVPPEFQDVTAGMYFRLEKFHRAGGKVGEKFRFCEPDECDTPEARTNRWRLRSLPTYQTRPFADIICRTTDGVEFHTHKIILCAASPILHDKIMTLDAARPDSQSLPVLQLEYPSRLFSTMLELCYPVEYNLEGLSTPDWAHLLQYLRQLQMKAVFTKVRYGSFISSDPFVAYLVTSHLGLQDIAEDAAGCLHGDPFIYGCIPIMESISALPYHKLLVNRRESLALAKKMTGKIEKCQAQPNDDVPSKGARDDAGQSDALASGDPWLRETLAKTVQQLHAADQKETWWHKPNLSDIMRESMKRKIWCEACEENARLMLDVEKTHADVQRAMSAHNNKLRTSRWM